MSVLDAPIVTGVLRGQVFCSEFEWYTSWTLQMACQTEEAGQFGYHVELERVYHTRYQSVILSAYVSQ